MKIKPGHLNYRIIFVWTEQINILRIFILQLLGFKSLRCSYNLLKLNLKSCKKSINFFIGWKAFLSNSIQFINVGGKHKFKISDTFSDHFNKLWAFSSSCLMTSSHFLTLTYFYNISFWRHFLSKYLYWTLYKKEF